MSETTAATLLLLRYIAQSSIAGALASVLFDRIRSSLLRAEPAPLQRLGAILSAPRYARWAALLLAALIGGAANVAIAYLAGGDVGAVTDSVVAGLLTMIVSQIAHGQSLSDAPKGMSNA